MGNGGQARQEGVRGAPGQQEMLGSDAEEKEVLGVLTRKPTEEKAELKFLIVQPSVPGSTSQ